MVYKCSLYLYHNWEKTLYKMGIMHLTLETYWNNNLVAAKEKVSHFCYMRSLTTYHIGFICDILMRKASVVCPDKVRPLLSTIVPDTCMNTRNIT